MGTARQDPLTGRWVIYAAGRSRRPNEFPVSGRDPAPTGNCPFCPGHEDQTTPEVVALGRPAGAAANGPGWQLRAFPNLFPAVVPQLDQAGPDGPPNPLFRQTAGLGVHQVVVYTPDHGASPGALDRDRWVALLEVLQEQSREAARHPAVTYVSVFCNHGPEAGATLAHPHMQVIGAPEVPLLAAAKDIRGADYLAEHGGCLLCDLAAAERAAGLRLVADNEHWTGFAPWASRFPWEMLFVPRRHVSSLRGATGAELAALADVLVPALSALGRLHGDLSLNIVSHGATVDAAGNDQGTAHTHWHVEVLPRLGRPAGFEVGTGCTINAVTPEEAVVGLRAEGGLA